MSQIPALQALLDEGVANRVFPSAQAVVLHRGERVFDAFAGDATSDTLFDLASLTKPMCTTSIFIKAWAGGELEPAGVLPDSKLARDGVTWADLLYHRSGLPAFVPFFASVFRTQPLLLSATCPPHVRLRVRDEVLRVARSTPLERARRATAVYSDVGFILLGDALEQCGGLPLDLLYERRVAGPLGLGARFRRLSSQKPARPAAPTGMTRPREPAPGQEGLWEPMSMTSAPSRPGEVDDDNAYVLDGVAGHAGLFGTARDVATFGQLVLDDFQGAGRLAPVLLWRRALCRDADTPHSTRALGFDTPADDPGQSTAGNFIGRIAPGAVGHTGFTGTSLWIDLARQLVVALCANRTYFGRANQTLAAFRPHFHDAVVTALGLEK